MAKSVAESSASVITDLLKNDAPYTSVPEELFNKLGNQLALPDAGIQVQAVVEAARGGAFDPRELERISSDQLGYSARWVVVNYQYYGLPWDITGLRLESA